MYYLAIDVGGTFTKYAVITNESQILQKDKQETAIETVEALVCSLKKIYSKVTMDYEISGIALSMPGVIDSKKGFMYSGGYIECIVNINIVELLEKQCRVSVTVENDAKCAAFAELWTGALSDCKDAIVVVCGTGVGGAVIHNREVIYGNNLLAGEFSFMLVESNQEYGMGYSLAENAGIKALFRYVSEETEISIEKLNGEYIFNMANQGNAKMITGIRRYVGYIAVQIHNIRLITNPQRVAIGGGISVQPLFIKMIREELTKISESMPYVLPMPEIVACKYFNDANLLGAVYMHMKLNERNN